MMDLELFTGSVDSGSSLTSNINKFLTMALGHTVSSVLPVIFSTHQLCVTEPELHYDGGARIAV
jgi:hypothetical protein